MSQGDGAANGALAAAAGGGPALPGAAPGGADRLTELRAVVEGTLRRVNHPCIPSCNHPQGHTHPQTNPSHSLYYYLYA